jgi:hypothetical protein
MRQIRLTENELVKLIKKVIKEDEDEFVTGVSASKRAELVDDVINRLREFGKRYEIELNKLNSKYNPEKVKRIRPRSMDDLDLPKNIRISKSTFPDY